MVYAGTAWAAGLIVAAVFSSVLVVFFAALISAFLFKTVFRFNLKSIIFMLITFTLAFGCYNLYDQQVYKKITDFAGSEISYSGTVTDFNDYADNESVYYLDGKINGKHNAKMVVYADTLSCETGDSLSFGCIADVFKNSYLFNSLDYYKSKGIYLQTNAVENIKVKPADGFSLNKSLYKFRENVSTLIDSSVASYEGGMIKGMLFGDKSGLEQDDKTMLYRVGIGHVTAVSGLHLVLFCTLISFLMKKFRSGKFLEFAVTEVFMILFALCCGMSPSIMRAFVMMTLINSSSLFFRYTDSLNSVCIAIIVLSVTNPFIILNQSFLLSISGAIGAGVFGPYMTRNIRADGTFRKLGKNVLYLLCVSVAVTPMSVICFGEFSVVSPLTNLVITPICMAALLIAMIASLLIFLNPVILFKVSGAICHIILKVSEIIGKNKFTHTKFSGEFISVLVILLLVFCITTYLIFKSKKYSVVSIIISVVFLFCFCTVYNITSRKIVKIALLGNEETGVIVISRGNRADIIDITGKPKNSRYAKKYLEELGIVEINSILLTNKPYLSSAAYNSELSLFDIKNIVLPENTYVREGTTICECEPKYSDFSNWNADYGSYRITVNGNSTNVECGSFDFECTDGKSGDKTYKPNTVLYAKSDGTSDFRRLEDG